ncbi:hypothetical protein XELAEV_18030513mg [Xenopus laevis]|uniref:Uncharacterized protein n=1 Tax=Xenopus laevis TaxID=8355 RepID=A0A974HEU5_XENLA|nr:hypothetical protein XELAEV_18030513mg [Xenopus laevis]
MWPDHRYEYYLLSQTWALTHASDELLPRIYVPSGSPRCDVSGRVPPWNIAPF